MKIFYFCFVLVTVAQQISQQDANSNYWMMSLFFLNFYLRILKLFLGFLRRSKRFLAIFEEMKQGNMERECFEEVLTSWDIFEFSFYITIWMSKSNVIPWLVLCHFNVLGQLKKFEKKNIYEQFSRSVGMR